MVKSILQPMNNTFTPDDLILFAYNETGNKKSGEINDAINENEELLYEYQSIKDIQQELDNIHKDPSEQAIKNILNYSRVLNVFKLKPAVNTVLLIVN